MTTRIFSSVVARAMTLALLTTTISVFSSNANGQGNSGYLTDPATGIVYRKVTKTIETPVVETHVRTSEQTVYRPQTITESRPHTRTVYSPVLEYKWEPRVYGRWNPFRPPTVGYQHVPHTTWEARNEVVHRTNTRTEWVAEKRTVEVPTRIVKMQREQKVDFEPVGRVNQQGMGPSTTNDALATRLRPLNDPSSIEPFGYSAPRIASSTVTSSYGGSARSASQQGLPPTQLAPTTPGTLTTPGTMAVPASTGVAASPLPIYR